MTILAILLSLLLQSMTGPMVRLERTRGDVCACRQKDPDNAGESCCCCKDRQAPAPTRRHEGCPCPNGCDQRTQARDTDTRAAVTQRSATRSVRQVAARPVFLLDDSRTLDGRFIGALVPTRRWAQAPPPRVVFLRSTVLVV